MNLTNRDQRRSDKARRIEWLRKRNIRSQSRGFETREGKDKFLIYVADQMRLAGLYSKRTGIGDIATGLPKLLTWT